MDLPDDAEVLVERSRQRYYRDDAVRWVWIFYGLAQATVTMLIAFDVLESTTVAAVVTVTALIVYVAVNEVLVRPYRSRTYGVRVESDDVQEPRGEHGRRRDDDGDDDERVFDLSE